MHFKTPYFFILAGLALLTASPASAQTVPATLSLSPATTVAQAGQTVTFTVVLSGGSDMGSYDFNLFLGSANLSYGGGSTFVFNPAAGFTSFPSSTVFGNNMEVSAGYPTNTSAGTQAGLALGSFSVVYGGPVGVTVPITLGLPGDAGAGGSQVFRLSDSSNELGAVTGASLTGVPPVPAPEPSALWTLSIGAALLGGVALLTVQAKKRSVTL